MRETYKLRCIYLSFFLLYSAALLFFYYKYVPLIKSFQLILLPVLFIIFLVTSLKISWGILVFVFTFILGNNLPYFFGIDEGIPHAPMALVFFLFFFLGWLLHSTLFPSKLDFDHPIFKPLILLSLIIIVSGIITFFRYANFFPFLSDNIYELIVNINGVRAGGAIMSDVFGCLSYLTGFLFFIVLFNSLKSKDFVRNLLFVSSVAIFLSLIFSLVQKYFSLSLGNTEFWIKLGRINATFKDPNSFGVILSSFLPLLFGMVLSIREKSRLFYLFLIVFGLVVFPSIGSRSGLLGLTASVLIFCLFYFTSSNISSKKKIGYGFTSFLIIIMLIFSILLFSRYSNLYQRIGWSVDVFANKESLNKLFTRKLDFWAAGFNMIQDYPLTGVGIGAFIIELPNYLSEMGKPFRYTDSAENYFVQGGSELGVIGLLLVLWMFYEIVRGIRKNWKVFQLSSKNKFIFIGVISGIVSIVINFFFHSYIGSYEVKYFFWMLAALALFYMPDQPRSLSAGKNRITFKIVAVILSLLFGINFLWNSTHSLSIESSSNRFGWDQNFGLYQDEKDDRGFFYNWAKKKAGIAVEILGPRMIIPIMGSHPDIGRKPLKVRMFSADKYFRKKELLKEIILKDTSWNNIVYDTAELTQKKIYFVFETDRTWNPSEYLGVPDPRKLAVKIGQLWFEYPKNIEKSMIKSVHKISNNNWEGEHKEKLYRNGISKIRFRTDNENVAIGINMIVGTAFHLGPYVNIRIDGRLVSKCMLNSEGRTSVVFVPSIKKGEHVLSIEYINYIHDSKLNQYRYVYLGDVDIIYLNQ